MPGALTTLISRFFTDEPLIRRMAAQAILSAFGTGAFLTGSAFYFTRIVGISAAHVGLGLTIGSAAAIALAVPMGRLADVLGTKQAWVLAACLEAALFLCWPLAKGMTSFLLLMVAMDVVDSLTRSSQGAYRLTVFSPEQRIRGLAHIRAYRNVGYTLGALAGGLALAAKSDVLIEWLPVAVAVILLANGLFLVRMPNVARAARTPRGERRTDGALRNRGYLATQVVVGVQTTHQVLLNTVIPLWLVTETDAPRVLLAWLFGTNTVMAVTLQVATAKGVDTVAASTKALWRGVGCFVLSCAIIAITHDTVGWVTIALVWLGHVTVTGAELFEAAGAWGLQAELSDPTRHGDYQGVNQLGFALGTVWAPALYTWLAMTWGTSGWVVIAAIVVASGLLLGPSVRAAETFRSRLDVSTTG